ncbi:MAG: acyltransferase family protein [Leptospirales bacterium]
MKKITLGWVRVLLALMVIDEHYGYFEHLFDWLVKKEGLTLHFSFVSDGDLGVTGFFIMSGFLVAEILENKYPSNSWKDFLHFVSSRYLRIFPLYLFVFCIYLLFIAAKGASWEKIALNAFLLPYGFSDFFSTDHLFDHILLTPAWTLSLDLVFYPIGYLFYKNRRFLLVSISALILYFCFVWFISPSESGTIRYNENSWWNNQVYSTAEPGLFAFLSGMFSRIFLKAVRIPVSLVTLSFLLLFYVCYIPYGISYFGSHFLGQASLLVIITAFARNGYSKEESFLGSLTYSTYLIHLPIFLVVSRIAPLEGISRLIPLAITLVFSLIVARLIEEELVERSRKKWLNSWKPTGTRTIMKSAGYNYLILALLFFSMAFYSHHYLDILRLPSLHPPAF